MMIRWSKTFMVMAAMLGVGVANGWTQETSVPADVSGAEWSLEQIQARITELESELIQAQAQRYQAKHGIEYSDPRIMPKRQEAKKLEKELLDTRAAYQERLRLLDETIRTNESSIARQQKEVGDMVQLAEAIQREIEFTAVTTNAATAGQRPVLEAEWKLAQEQIQSKRDAIAQATKDLHARQAEVTARDATCAELAARVTKLEKDYLERFGAMHRDIDEKEAIANLDKARLEIGRAHV